LARSRTVGRKYLAVKINLLAITIRIRWWLASSTMPGERPPLFFPLGHPESPGYYCRTVRSRWLCPYERTRRKNWAQIVPAESS
jgi:hypothetical protein